MILAILPIIRHWHYSALATLIADPQKMTLELANKWVGDIYYYQLADMFAGMIAQSKNNRFWDKLLDDWINSPDEFVKQSGYSLLASLLKNKTDFSDKKLKDIIKKIESKFTILQIEPSTL